MFKKTDTSPQYELFSTSSPQLGKRGSIKYDDPKTWHNQFYCNVTSRIDKPIFFPLFKTGNMGVPNALMRVIIDMSLIKKGFGYSDEDLLEKCEFDLIVTNLDAREIIPAHQIGDKWRITTNGKFKYKSFTLRQIENSALKRKLVSMPIEEQMKRNNVEAIMSQYCSHSRNNRTRYRGLLKHKQYSYARCLWMNHVRLMMYLIRICQGTTENRSKNNFRYLNDSIMEMLLFFVNFILPNSVLSAAENSTKYNAKLKNVVF